MICATRPVMVIIGEAVAGADLSRATALARYKSAAQIEAATIDTTTEFTQ